MTALGQPPSKFIIAPANDSELAPIRDWLKELLNDRRYGSPPLSLGGLSGTDFQKTVWKAMLAIPPGETCSYMDLAREIGRPRAARAVGAASAANPIPPLIPCHRMVGSNGDLRGYADGLPMKRTLLDIERSI
jgi:O-6-methylguanine DNA methyltransferase